MISLASAGAQQFTRRFLLVSWIPSALLLLLLFGLTWSMGTTNSCRQAPCIDRAVDTATDSYGIRIALVVLAGMVASLVLHPLQIVMVRFLEGYWDRWRVGRDVGGWLVEHRHARRFERLEAVIDQIGEATELSQERSTRLPAAQRRRQGRLLNAAAVRRNSYPAADRLMPTMLGNVLRAAEDLAGNRYGLRAVLIWPRLYAVLPERPFGILNEQRMQLDIAVQFCFVLAVGSLVSLWFLLGKGWWLLLPLALLTLAWLSYRAAVAVATAYGTMMATVIDLHRFDLLQALHLPLPKDRQHEERANSKLCEVVEGRDPQFRIEMSFEHPQPVFPNEGALASVARPSPQQVPVGPAEQRGQSHDHEARGGED